MRFSKKYFLLPLLLTPLLFLPGKLPIYEQNAKTMRKGFRSCAIEKNGEQLLLKKVLKPSFIVFDVGANQGIWSQAALEIEPKIHLYSFEPVEKTYHMLAANLKNFPHARLFPIAMSDTPGSSTFYYYPHTSELSGFSRRQVLNHQEVQEIPVTLSTIDAFCQEQGISHIDLLKVDTEGAEWKVLQGSEKMLSQHKIRYLQFEYGGTFIDSGSTLKEVCQFLTDKGYLIFRVFRKGLVHFSHWEDSMENYRYSNYFAARKEDFSNYSLMEF